MRKLFLAVAATEGLDPVASQIIKKMKINTDQRQIEVRWIPQNNYHVTLVFLGNIDEKKIPEIEHIAGEVAKHIAPFPLKIADVGGFPDEFSSRVLWFGVQNSKALRHLQETLSLSLKNSGYTLDEREYSPHLTIGRLRNPQRTRDLISPFVRKKIAKIQITEFILYESLGSHPFPVYKPLVRFQLTGVPADAQELE